MAVACLAVALSFVARVGESTARPEPRLGFQEVSAAEKQASATFETRIKEYLFSTLLCSSVSSHSFSQNLANSSPAVKLALPLKEGSLRFAVMGDTGSGSAVQRQVADMMVSYRLAFPFDFVLMMGDNLYGAETPRDFEKKFSNVYKLLLDAKVKDQLYFQAISRTGETVDTGVLANQRTKK